MYRRMGSMPEAGTGEQRALFAVEVEEVVAIAVLDAERNEVVAI